VSEQFFLCSFSSSLILHDQKVGHSEKQWMDGWMWMDVMDGCGVCMDEWMDVVYVWMNGWMWCMYG